MKKKWMVGAGVSALFLSSAGAFPTLAADNTGTSSSVGGQLSASLSQISQVVGNPLQSIQKTVGGMFTALPSGTGSSTGTSGTTPSPGTSFSVPDPGPSVGDILNHVSTVVNSSGAGTITLPGGCSSGPCGGSTNPGGGGQTNPGGGGETNPGGGGQTNPGGGGQTNPGGGGQTNPSGGSTGSTVTPPSGNSSGGSEQNAGSSHGTHLVQPIAQQTPSVLPNTGSNSPLYILAGLVMLISGLLLIQPIRRLLRSWR